MVPMTTLICFLAASSALTIAPGPDNLFILAQGVARGRKTAVITALGMCSGITVHTTAAALGVSALLYASAAAFTAVKCAGASYLLYLAWKTIRCRSVISLDRACQLSNAELFRRGFIMNVLNPKVALFFIAFLPQFVTPGIGNPVLQMLLLGVLFMLQAVIIFCLIGYCAGSIGGYVTARPGLNRYFTWLTAGTFGLLGVKLLLAER